MIRVDPEGWTHLGRTRDDQPVVLNERTGLMWVGRALVTLDHVEPGFGELLAACLTRKPKDAGGAVAG